MPIFIVMKNIGQALQQARTRLGLSQRKLADILAVSPSFLSDIENGKRSLPPARLKDLPPQILSAVLAARVAELERELEDARMQLAVVEEEDSDDEPA
jgi:transcriptional regulator with XRE-family HTH domain